MKEPLPPKGKQPPAPKVSARKPRTGEPGLPLLLVRYYFKMHPQGAYPLTVCWKTERGGDPDPAAIPPVVVRPFIPGSLVTPPERTLDPSATGREAVFSVTPLALGRVKGAYVEAVPTQGGPALDVTLPVKVVRQRLTKWLLLLTVLAPALFLYVTRTLRDELKGEVAEGRLKGRLKQTLGRPQGGQLQGQGQRPGRGQPAPRRPQRGAQQPDMARGPRMVALDEGEMLELLLLENMPSIPYFTEYVAEGLGVGYHFLCTFAEDNPLAFWIGVAFLVLTGASWVSHMTSRARRRSKAIQFTRAAGARPHAGGAAEPIVVEPID
jgi:hypothetical protein